MSTKSISTLATALLVSAALIPAAFAADPAGQPGLSSGKSNPLRNVYFGEQHLRTQDAPDAFAMGTRKSVDDAYNFCKGKAINKSNTGKMVQMKVA